MTDISPFSNSITGQWKIAATRAATYDLEDLAAVFENLGFRAIDYAD
jgi:hypothetical protein